MTVPHNVHDLTIVTIAKLCVSNMLKEQKNFMKYEDNFLKAVDPYHIEPLAGFQREKLFYIYIHISSYSHYYIFPDFTLNMYIEVIIMNMNHGIAVHSHCTYNRLIQLQY